MNKWKLATLEGWKVVGFLSALSIFPTFELSAQCPDGSPLPCRVQPTRVAPPPNSVAVLYFDNLSRDTTDAYLADGLTEEVINRLGRVLRLTVKSREAVWRFRGQQARDPAVVGRGLNVTYLVSGSFRRVGGRLRVAAELVRAATGDRLWGNRYERAEHELFELEDDVVAAVATAVVGRLLPAERASLTTRPATNLEAYTQYLKGRFEIERGTEQGHRAAVDYFRRAIALDSAFGRAFAGLADAYNLLADFEPPRNLLTNMRAAAERATTLEAGSGEALTSLAGSSGLIETSRRRNGT